MDERFNKLFDYWYFSISEQGKSKYYDRYNKIISEYIKPHFRNYKMKNITVMLLNSFKGKMLSLKHRTGGPEGYEGHKLIVDFVKYAIENNQMSNKIMKIEDKKEKENNTDEEVEEVYRKMQIEKMKNKNKLN